MPFSFPPLPAVFAIIVFTGLHLHYYTKCAQIQLKMLGTTDDLIESTSPVSTLQWSSSILVPTVYITVFSSDQHFCYVQVALPADVDGGVYECQ